MRKILQFNTLRFPLLFVAFAALLAGCDEKEEPTESLGGKSYAVYLKAGEGVRKIDVETSGEWSASLTSNDWVTVTPKSGSAKGSIELQHRANDSFPRKARLVISSGAVGDTLYLMQYGVTPSMLFLPATSSSPGLGAVQEVVFATNIPAAFAGIIENSVVGSSSEEVDWITDIALSPGLDKVTFNVAGNETDAERSATIVLSFTDEWGNVHTAEHKVEQKATGGSTVTQAVTFEELRGRIGGATGELTITDDICITGVVVSDCNNPNVAMNPNTDLAKIDYTENYRTAYLQNANGSLGVRLSFDDQEDNVLRRYDKLTLWLKDLTLVKESNPERYTLKSVKNGCYIEIAAGSSSDIPAKEKTIAQLTDNDLYTFVTLTDCEFPIREGSFTPINEGYGSLFNAYRMDCYPLLVRDKSGSDIFLMTNLDCTYRRDGSGLPQGSGKISGVVVNEKYARFEKDGNIGKYQIRHLTREDIAISESFDSGFSEMIVEWTRYNLSDGNMMSTTGTGIISHTSPSYANTGYATNDYSDVGPVGGTNKGDISGGGFANSYWWNSATGSGFSWVIEFSTEGVSSNMLSMQIATVNNSFGPPKYWIAEWSEHGQESGSWSKIADYTVPDAGYWSSTLLTQLPAHKNMNFTLPTAMLGKSKVYVRLRAAQNKAGTATSYDGGVTTTTTANAISYVGIRYNK